MLVATPTLALSAPEVDSWRNVCLFLSRLSLSGGSEAGTSAPLLFASREGCRSVAPSSHSRMRPSALLAALWGDGQR